MIILNTVKINKTVSTFYHKGKIVVSFFIIVLSLLVCDCEEEKPEPRVYPRVNTLPVTNITEEGATLNADIYSLGTEIITEYGFVWGTRTDPDIKTDNKVIISVPAREGEYTADIRSTLLENQEYTVRSYVITDEHTVYGKPVTFVSLGSLAPVITSFYPDSAAWGDTLTITGRNFSWVKVQNEVKLGEIGCGVLSSTDTTINVIIPYYLTLPESSLTVDLTGNRAEYSQKKFKLIPPSLIDFYPKQARWGDTLHIKGNKINYVTYPESYVRLGTVNCQYLIDLISDSSISVIIPYDLDVVNSTLSLKLNEFLLQGEQEFELLSPYFTFSPLEGTWGTIVTLNGKFNTITSKNDVYFNDKKASIVSSEAEQIKVTVPEDLVDIESNIIYKVNPFEITSTDTFSLKPPIINSFEPITGAGGTTVTIRGKYFGGGTLTVKFGEITADISSFNDSTIIVKVPSEGYGLVKISVTAGLQTILSASDFDVTNPQIDSFFPLTATFNDEITIIGQNLIPSGGSTNVYFGDNLAPVISATQTTIVAQVPSSIDSIPRQIRISNSQGNNATSTDFFTLLPHKINSVTPSILVCGEDIIIEGENFNPDVTKNTVLINECYLTLKSANSTQIIATVPLGLPRGTFKIKIITGGYIRLSTQEFTVNSQWLRVPSPILTTYNETFRFSMPVTGEGLANYGYICSLADDGVTYRFDPVSYSWTKLSTSANVDYSNHFYNVLELVCQDTFYLIYGLDPVLTGIDHINEFWKYKPESLQYNSNSVAFSLKNKIYFGFNSNNTNGNFFEINPSDNYLMTRSSDFPVYSYASITTCFSIDENGYVLFTNNDFWKFDSETLLWIQLTSFPGPERYISVSFVLDGYGYIGTGKYGSTTYSDVWKYDPLTDSWIFVTNMPNPRSRALALTINGKAYIGYGTYEYPQYNYIDLYDFYEFDPNYSLK